MVGWGSRSPVEVNRMAESRYWDPLSFALAVPSSRVPVQENRGQRRHQRRGWTHESAAELVQVVAVVAIAAAKDVVVSDKVPVEVAADVDVAPVAAVFANPPLFASAFAGAPIDLRPKLAFDRQ
jgi:hypothetical protein